MRLLFDIDKKNYGECTRTFRRDSARSIIIRQGKVAMLHSGKYDSYEFPGGGIEPGETPIEAMIRETREEAGLIVRPGTVREYGCVHRIKRNEQDPEECFIQDNLYYLCDAEEHPVPQRLTESEAEESIRLEFIEPALAIQKNRRQNAQMLEREIRILEMLIAEGLIKG